MTSLRTIYAFLGLASGYRATGFSTQSELLPSACMVELPSKPQLGRSARAGGCSNALSRLLPRRSGTGFFPSSQMYSSLYFVIVFGGSVGSGHSDARPSVLQTTEQLSRFKQGSKYRARVSVVKFIKSIDSIQFISTRLRRSA